MRPKSVSGGAGCNRVAQLRLRVIDGNATVATDVETLVVNCHKLAIFVGSERLLFQVSSKRSVGYRVSGEIACESSNDIEVSRAAVRALWAYLDRARLD